MAKKKKYYAIITGDIVESSKLNNEQKNKVIGILKKVFTLIEQQQKKTIVNPSFEIYRGDSFQGVVVNLALALEYSIMIRVFLRKSFDTKTEDVWDARIALGIGEIEHFSEKLAECDGPAFRNSGPVLDNMKNEERIIIRTPWKEVNDEFYAECALLDVIMSKWTAPQSEVIAELLLNGLNQAKIAKKLKISQSAVNQRIKAANWNAVEKMIGRYQSIISMKR